MDYRILPATPFHCAFVAQHLREADEVELRATCKPGQTNEEILLEALRKSHWANAVEVEGEIALVYGVTPSTNIRMGVPWMLSTDVIYKMKKSFIQDCRGEVELMHAAFPFLFNCVHKDNLVSINWLKWLGFNIVEKPIGPNRDIYYFWRGNPHV